MFMQFECYLHMPAQKIEIFNGGHQIKLYATGTR